MICYFNFIVINQQYLFCRVVAIKPASGRLIVSKMNCDQRRVEVPTPGNWMIYSYPYITKEFFYLSSDIGVWRDGTPGLDLLRVSTKRWRTEPTINHVLRHFICKQFYQNLVWFFFYPSIFRRCTVRAILHFWMLYLGHSCYRPSKFFCSLRYNIKRWTSGVM